MLAGTNIVRAQKEEGRIFVRMALGELVRTERFEPAEAFRTCSDWKVYHFPLTRPVN